MDTDTETTGVPCSDAVDWSVLEGLRELQIEGEPDFVQEMIAMFLDESPELVAAIGRAVAQGEAEALRNAAHTLKSQCYSLGARQMGTQCADLEALGRSGSVEGTAEKLAGLEREYERVKQAFLSRR